jgi:hypothetical protein
MKRLPLTAFLGRASPFSIDRDFAPICQSSALPHLKSLMISMMLSMAVISNGVGATEHRNIAYEDDYIWYLARGMADWQMDVVFPSGVPADVDFQLRSDAALIYHHHLVECDGPLNDIAKLDSFGVSYDDMSKSDLLHFIGVSGKDVRPILAKWNIKIFPVLAALMASGKISTELPSCVNENYVAPTIND